MDFKCLFSIMNRKKFYYLDGNLSSLNNNFNFYFSTEYNGRGNAVEIRIGDLDNDVTSYIKNKENKDIVTEIKNINDNELFLFLDKL